MTDISNPLVSNPLVSDPLVVVEQSVSIAASPETVWEFWTDANKLVEWWGVAGEMVPEPGGIFCTVMENGMVMRGTYVELDPPNRLVFTFGWEHNAPGELLAPGSTRVEVTLSRTARGTELVLRHSEMPTSHAGHHREGWASFVGEGLVAAVERASR